MEAAGAMEGTESQDVCPHAPGEGEELKTDKITRMFLRYIPLVPKMRIAVPSVNGSDIANAQGHATIKTDVRTKIAV